MTTNFPGSLDTTTELPNIASTDHEDDAGLYHDVVHDNVNDALRVIEAKIGADASTVSTSHDYKLRNVIYLPNATGSEDDSFDDGTFSGWTSVEGNSGTLTVTEANGWASIVNNGNGTGTPWLARVKAHTFATNDWCEAAFAHTGINQNHNMIGICMSNGTTFGTSNAIHWSARVNNNAWRMQRTNGFNADTAQNEYSTPSFNGGMGNLIYLRLKYNGSNSFDGLISSDGVSWITIASAISYTLSPTHWGMSLGSYGGTNKFMASFAYFRTGNG